MLSERCWRPDAVMRLVGSVFVCLLIGAALQPLVRFFSGPQTAQALLIPALSIGAIGCFAGALVVLGRPWPIERLARRSLVLLAFIYLGLALMGVGMHLRGEAPSRSGSVADIIVAVVCLQGATLILTHGFLREHQIGWADAFGLRIGWSWAIALGILVGFAFLLVGGGMQQVSYFILEQFQLNPQEQIPVKVLRQTGRLFDRIVMGVAAIAVAPVAEEILFRGILYPAIKQRGHPHLALWGTALVFGAIHMNLATMLPLTVLALILTWLYERTNNLLAPIAAHCCFNALNFTLLYAVPWLQEKFKLLPQP